MGTIANAKVTHYYNSYNGYFVECLRYGHYCECKGHTLLQLLQRAFYRMLTLLPGNWKVLPANNR